MRSSAPAWCLPSSASLLLCTASISSPPCAEKLAMSYFLKGLKKFKGYAEFISSGGWKNPTPLRCFECRPTQPLTALHRAAGLYSLYTLPLSAQDFAATLTAALFTQVLYLPTGSWRTYVGSEMGFLFIGILKTDRQQSLIL